MANHTLQPSSDQEGLQELARREQEIQNILLHNLGPEFGRGPLVEVVRRLCTYVNELRYQLFEEATITPGPVKACPHCKKSYHVCNKPEEA